MARAQLKGYQEIFERMVARVVARTALSDLTDSSVVTHILAACARELDDAYYQMARVADSFSIDQATGADLDARAAEIQPGTISRLAPTRASGFVVFSRPINDSTTITIPAGTQVRSASGVIATTSEEGVISNSSIEQLPGHGSGRDSAPVHCVAAAAGASGNLGANALTQFVARPPGVFEVTNVSALSGGRDQEDDDSFRARLKTYVSSLSQCTNHALESLVLGIADPTPLSGRIVTSAHLFEDPIDLANSVLFIDDGNGTAETTEEVDFVNVTAGLAGPDPDTAVGGEEYLYLPHAPVDLQRPFTLWSVDDTDTGWRGELTRDVDYRVEPSSGRLYFTPPLVSGERIRATYTRFSGLIEEVQRYVNGDPTDAVTYPGWKAAGTRVLVRAPVVVDVTIDAVLMLEAGADAETVRTNVESAVTAYINTRNISDDVVRNEIIERIMRVTGVYDVNLLEPTANIAILDHEVARTSPASLSIEV